MTEIEAAAMTAMGYAIATNAEINTRAKAEGWTFWTTLPEDPIYWAESGLKTGADVLRRDLIATYSDTYKEIHGIRPRWVDFTDSSISDIEAELSRLYKESEPEPEPEPEPMDEKPLTYSPFTNLKLS